MARNVVVRSLVDRIVWIAAADARGHLMRAQLIRRLLAPHRIEVEIFTTSEEGREFLVCFDTPSQLLSQKYRVEFAGAQNLDRRATERRIVEYFFAAGGWTSDFERIGRAARGAKLVVNDFHPALLWRGAERWPLVHLYGHNLRRAIESHFEESGPRVLDRSLKRYVRRRLERSVARIEHGIGAGTTDPGAIVLPPLLASPAKMSFPTPLAAIYLNPHFKDPRLAARLEEALQGFALHAVGEGYADRPGWIAVDDQFTSAVAACEVLISAPGLGALGLASLLNRPFLAILTDQPEQRQNYLSARQILSCAAISANDSAAEIREALKSLPPAPPCSWDAIEHAQQEWVTTFRALIARSDKELAA